MKLISLCCNHCGAPIEVRKSAKFVTCGYCNAHLAIHHTGSSYSTELLEEIKQTTDTLVRDVQMLKGDSEIDRLDREWERNRLELMTTNKNGTQSVPEKGTAIAMGGFVAVFGVFWTIGAGIAFPPMALFGIVFVCMAIWGIIHTCQKADEYQRLKQRYHERRRQLINERNQHRGDRHDGTIQV
ncbi:MULTISPECIES: hypothetical protein [Pirellulaceae]|uniref:RNA polymerase-binding transcription factor DksA n=1 Tax=Aporhodopirellula rubra TaxID=980271 RepID=A0A7W5DZH0_9BACT|nr:MULTISPECIES: hypothetical protein [Pirellulaceae]EMI40515.1 putative membrane protein [Rhodopirellula sp. SWK7]MBB3207034.1 RNA polymerase-binding transcription factor DksA [Aporhodopirellula rubra]